LDSAGWTAAGSIGARDVFSLAVVAGRWQTFCFENEKRFVDRVHTDANGRGFLGAMNSNVDRERSRLRGFVFEASHRQIGS
jgi:carotenoid cleavage dioxygenase-like enzyme